MQLERWPNLFIPGAPKSGTTTLFSYLAQHESICAARQKEPHYFSIDERWHGRRDWYLDLFGGCANVEYWMEASTTYMVSALAVERIAKTCTDPRFLFVFRNPIDRIWSHYWWLRGQGLEWRPLRVAVEADLGKKPRLGRGVLRTGRFRYYYQFSSYGSVLRRFREKFDNSNILVLNFESLCDDTSEAVADCLEWLGLDPLSDLDAEHRNPTRIERFAVLMAWARYARGRSRGLLNRFGWELKPLSRSSREQFTGWFGFRKGRYPEMSSKTRLWLRDLLRDEVAILRASGFRMAEWDADFPPAGSTGGLHQGGRVSGKVDSVD